MPVVRNYFSAELSWFRDPVYFMLAGKPVTVTIEHSKFLVTALTA